MGNVDSTGASASSPVTVLNIYIFFYKPFCDEILMALQKARSQYITNGVGWSVVVCMRTKIAYFIRFSTLCSLQC